MATLHDTTSTVNGQDAATADHKVTIDATFVDVAASVVSQHETVVSEIVGMIRDKFTEEAKRSFAIGERFYKHAVWQKNHFPGEYTNTDLTNLASRIRDEVRVHVAVKPESIRVADWARCFVLRTLVAKEAGDGVADSLSMYEYLAIVGKALHFNVRDLEGDLNPCWLDMIKGVAVDRAADKRVSTEQFFDRIKATVATAAAARVAKLDPAAAQAAAASSAVKADKAAKTKAEKSVLESIDNGIKAGAIRPETALEILESVAAFHGKPLVSNAIGFNPTTATIADCDTLAAAMFSAGKLVEMKHLAAKLAKGIAAMEKAAKRAAAPTSEPAVAA